MEYKPRNYCTFNPWTMNWILSTIIDHWWARAIVMLVLAAIVIAVIISDRSDPED